MTHLLDLERLLGPRGPGIVAAMRAGRLFLERHRPPQLLARLGQRVDEVPPFDPIDKSALQDSYGGNQTGPSDDFLVGLGLFYFSEQRKLYLDCTSGHYQMLWGYQHPELCAALEAAAREGVIWDNHSNIPQSPLKQLGHRLLALANDPGDADPLNKVLLGVCTGSVACAAALKIQLKVYERNHGRSTVPVIVSLAGNYHGSDLAPQFMRGMWPHLTRPFETIILPPNDADALERVFQQHGTRIAGFWAEPVMMNREALPVHLEYLELAARWCRETGALFCVDEIQTGFWRPEIFDFRALGLRPDLVVLGKGLAAGFHPLSGVLFRHRHDVLEQYDAISTNGSAALPAFVALGSLALIEREADRLRAVARQIEAGFQSLAAEFPECVEGSQGRGYLLGLKLRNVADARELHRRLLGAGLWTRVHAYHEGHRTVLTKLGLLADEPVVAFVLEAFRRQLRELSGGGASTGRPATARVTVPTS